jgi:hypothetical protein
MYIRVLDVIILDIAEDVIWALFDLVYLHKKLDILYVIKSEILNYFFFR